MKTSLFTILFTLGLATAHAEPAGIFGSWKGSGEESIDNPTLPMPSKACSLIQFQISKSNGFLKVSNLKTDCPSFPNTLSEVSFEIRNSDLIQDDVVVGNFSPSHVYFRISDATQNHNFEYRFTLNSTNQVVYRNVLDFTDIVAVQTGIISKARASAKGNELSSTLK